MNNTKTARIVTILVLAGALSVVVLRKADFSARRQSDKPQDAIYAMLDAARTGDVTRYIASYTGETAQSLARAKSESPDFAKYLRDSNSQIKGIAVMEPETQPDGQVELRVEYVYQDRNEAQFFFLARTLVGWKISRIESAERVKTVVPYGTPVQ